MKLTSRRIAIILFILVLEVGIRAVEGTYWWIKRRIPAATAASQPALDLSTINQRELLPYYRQQEWSDQYWPEFYQYVTLEVRNRYVPFALWRGVPFRGETININEAGIRQTPGAACGNDSYNVFVFGGSNIWGDGAPDWLTIPADLQAGLAATMNQPVCVVNFGQLGYVSTQEMIALQLELAQGNIPDVVIFYDGVNEALQGYATGNAQAHKLLPSFTTVFDKPSGGDWLTRSRLYQIVQGAITPPTPMVNYQTLKVDKDELAEALSQNYLHNYRMIRALAQEYKFEFYLFWQPVIYATHKQLSDEEQLMKLAEDALHPGFAELCVALYERIEAAAAPYPRLYNLTGIFDDKAGTIFGDFIHTTPEGNQYIADEIMKVITS